MKRFLATAALAAAFAAPAFAQANNIAEVPPEKAANANGQVIVEGVTEDQQVNTKVVPPGEAATAVAADPKPLVSASPTQAVDQQFTEVKPATAPMTAADGTKWVLEPGATKEVAIAANGEVIAKPVADIVESNKRYNTEDLAKAQLAALDGSAAPDVTSKPATDRDATTAPTAQPLFERKTLTAQAATEATQATASGGQ